MITNLLFKRTVNIEGSSRTEMKIIEVNIPELKRSEGWTLVSSADKIEQIKLNEDKSVPNHVDGVDRATNFLNNLMVGLSNCNAQSNQEVIQKSATDSANVDIIEANNAELLTNMAIMKTEAYDKVEEIKKSEPKELVGTMNEAYNLTPPPINPDKVVEFKSPINGTACLIRKNDVIRIAYRKGKQANITNPNRICISDRDKQSFFNAVRACNPTSIITDWCLTPKDHHFKHWNAFIDNEYQEQKREYIRIENMEKKKNATDKT